jgi:hypothetical protein
MSHLLTCHVQNELLHLLQPLLKCRFWYLGSQNVRYDIKVIFFTVDDIYIVKHSVFAFKPSIFYVIIISFVKLMSFFF